MMFKRWILLAVVFAFVLSGCSGLGNMGPDVTDAQRAKILKMAKKKQFNKKKLPKTKSYRIKLKKGHWAATLTTMKTGNKDVTLTIHKVISVKGRTVVLETEVYTASADGVRTVSQVTLENYPVKSNLCYSEADADKILSDVKVTKMISKHGNEPARETPPQMLMMVQSMGKDLCKNMVRTGALEKKPVTTPYFKASQAYVYDIKISAFGFSSTPKIYAHSKVPVTGQLKLEDENMVVETIAYGFSGAKSLL